MSRFSLMPTAQIQRSSFKRDHNLKTTFDAGKLIPFYCDEVLPGDTVNLNVTSLCRLATPIVPLMDNIYLDTFFFFVPNRLVWNNFQKFMGEQEDPGDSTDYLIPQLFSSDSEVEVDSVLDYFGFPLGDIYGATYNKLNASALPLRALCLIWNEWFRDENLQDSIKINKTDSSGYTTDVNSLPNGLFNLTDSCLPRGKRHDYFTSALPWPQKGDSVDIPLGTSAPVVTGAMRDMSGLKPMSFAFSANDNFPQHAGIKEWHNHSDYSQTGNVGYKTAFDFLTDESYSFYPQLVPSSSLPDGSSLNYVIPNNLYADLSSATAATINTLRQAFAVQRLLERDTYGTRYTEILLSHFGVRSPDARLQRPEYLGGDSTPFNINPVTQTSSTDSTTPQGNLSAFGVNGAHYHGFTKSFVEHGYIIGLMCVRADLNYQQGLERMWSRKTRFDFYWPELAHLGAQAIFNKEIYAQGTEEDDGVFGYQERFAEYRYKPNYVTGKFRSTYAQSLDSWHLAQKFDSLPTLSSDFIIENPPIDRVIAVPSEPQFIIDCFFRENWVRPMPIYGTPGLSKL